MFTPYDKATILLAKENITNKLHTDLQSLSLPFMVRDHVFVSGGAICSLINGEQPNDYDVYCKNELTAKSFSKFFSVQHNQHSVADVNEKYRDFEGTNGKVITENAVTLKSGLQIITGNYGTPKDVRSTFDFVHCLPYYDLAEDKLYISYPQFQACKQKKLIVNNPITVTDKRKQKFLDRGFTLNGNIAI